MKYFTLILLFITCHAYGQDLTQSEDLYLVPAIGKTKPGFIQFKELGETIDTVIYVDGSRYYLFSSSDGNNAPGTMIRIMVAQIPMNYVPDTVVVPPPVVYIDTVDASNSNFFGNWRVGETVAPGWYANTIAYSSTANDSATYTFSFPYRKIEIYGEKRSTHGIIALSIDGGNEIMIDLYSTTNELPALLHTFEVPLGMHKIKCRITGTKNAASTAMFGLVDFYRITR